MADTRLDPRLDNKPRLFAKIGSFWYRNTQETTRQQARTMVHMPDWMRAQGDIEEVENLLLSKPRLIHENLVVHFRQNDVVQVGADLNERLKTRFGSDVGSYVVIRRPDEYTGNDGWAALMTEDDPPYQIQTESCQYLLFPFPGTESDYTDVVTLDEYSPRWMIPIPEGMFPICIAGTTRDLVQSLDFEVYNGYILLDASPEILGDALYIRAAEVVQTSVLHYPLKVNSRGPVNYVANYYRNSQSAVSFQLAIAQAAGLTILPESGICVAAYTSCQITRYIFENFFVEVNYPHTALTVGNWYEKDFIIGDVVKIYTKGDSNLYWYRQLDWGAGLSLDTLCPFTGIVVPDRPCRAFAQGETDDVHVRIDFGLEDTTNEDVFWAHIKASEIKTGKYLNAVVALADTDDVAFINPLDIWFKYLLSLRGLIIVLRTSTLGAEKRDAILNFIDREKPIGCIPIVLES